MLKATLKLERETKGALLYRETDAKGNTIENFSDGVVGNVYIRKSAMPQGEAYPEMITITVEPK